MRTIDPTVFHPYEAAFRPNVRIGEYAYSLCGGPCAGMVFIEDPQMLLNMIRICLSKKIPYRVVGGLSNLLVSDSGFDGVIILNRKGSVQHQDENNGSIRLDTDSGTPVSNVVRYCAANGLSGFEWACGLPGTIGGAVYGNAGAFGTDIAEIIHSCKMIDPDGSVQEALPEKLSFSYRSSILKRQAWDQTIWQSSFTVKKDDPELIRLRGEENLAKRHSGQPVSERSLGSVFKNPEGMSAGKLIQDADLKGFSIGNATVSMKHANFITTQKGVRSEDYRKLILYVQQVVFDRFGVQLEPEIEFLGFED